MQKLPAGDERMVHVKIMPRSAGLDAPGILHPVMGRGIERRKIFLADQDRKAYCPNKRIIEVKLSLHASSISYLKERLRGKAASS